MQKYKRSFLTFGALAMAAAATASGQEASSVPSGTNAIPQKATIPAAQAGEASASKSAVRFEGTDLKLGRLPPVTFHGFASQGLIASTDYNYMGKTAHGLGSAEFNEFGLNASMSPFPHTRISAQAFTFDMGNVGNYEPVLDYATVDYNFCDEFGVRGGRIRRPSGIYNHIMDVDMARTYVLLPQGVYDARWRDFSVALDGGSLYGNVALGKAGSVSYEAFAGMVNLSKEGGLARGVEDSLRSTRLPYTLDEAGSNPFGGLQLWWNTPLEGFRMGYMIAYSAGMNLDATLYHPLAGRLPFHVDADNLGNKGSLEYVWRSWTFQAEFNNRAIEQSQTVGRTLTTGKRDPFAWFIAGAYRVNKWMEVGTYYTEDYENDSSITVSSDKKQKDLALSLRFDPKPWWTVKLEGHSIHGTALIHDGALNPVRNSEGWFMLAAKTTFSF
jgi:hypothetical protein